MNNRSDSVSEAPLDLCKSVPHAFGRTQIQVDGLRRRWRIRRPGTIEPHKRVLSAQAINDAAADKPASSRDQDNRPLLFVFASNAWRGYHFLFLPR